MPFVAVQYLRNRLIGNTIKRFIIWLCCNLVMTNCKFHSAYDGHKFSLCDIYGKRFFTI